MDITEKAREHLVKERRHDEHVQDTMHNRTQAELANTEDSPGVAEQLREALVKQLHQEEHVQQLMLERAEAEVEQKA